MFYDSTKPMPASKFRDDIVVLGVPLTAICNREYTDPRQRQLFKNIIYLGALSALLDIDAAVIEKLFFEQFKGKEKLIGANKHALHLGRDWVLLNMEPHPAPAAPAACASNVTGALCLVKRLASGLCGLQSSGGNETRQKCALGWANPIPISGICSCPGLMSFTMQTSSSPVATWVILKSCPTRTGSRRRIRPP